MFGWFKRLMGKNKAPDVRIIPATPPRMYAHFDGMERLIQRGREAEARVIIAAINKAQRHKKRHSHLLEQLRALEVK